MQEMGEASEQVCVRQLGMSPETAHSRRVRLPAHQLLITKQKLEKKIPGAPANEVPVHERKRQIYAQSITTQ